MKKDEGNRDKELYRQLRALSCDRLREDMARFDRASGKERRELVGLVRAVGVVFSESGSDQQKEEARSWLRGLLRDPNEKIRRYAMAALPKLGAGTGEEAELLALLRTTTVEREKKFLGQTLEKIGGGATLAEIEKAQGLGVRTEQKVRASVARRERPSTVRMDGVLEDFAGLRIHLHGRAGLEGIVREEVAESAAAHGKFRAAIDEAMPFKATGGSASSPGGKRSVASGEEGSTVQGGLVTIAPQSPFCLADLYTLRCFGTVGFVLGMIERSDGKGDVEALANIITSSRARSLFQAFTDGAIRYRLDFVDKGHQRGAVRAVAARAYELCPEILNDARQAPWSVAVHPAGRGYSVESFQHIGILSLEFHVDKLSRPLL